MSSAFSQYDVNFPPSTSALWPEMDEGTLPVPSNAIREPAFSAKVYISSEDTSYEQFDGMMIMYASNAIYLTASIESSEQNTLYAGIVARQYQRAQSFIDTELQKLEWEGEEENDHVIARIAEALDLVGEPAIYAAFQELIAKPQHRFTTEKLLHAISMAREQTTEQHRVDLLVIFSRESDPSVRYSAVEALGNMAAHSDRARTALREISREEPDRQIARLADLYAR